MLNMNISDTSRKLPNVVPRPSGRGIRLFAAATEVPFAMPLILQKNLQDDTGAAEDLSLQFQSMTPPI